MDHHEKSATDPEKGKCVKKRKRHRIRRRKKTLKALEVNESKTVSCDNVEPNSKGDADVVGPVLHKERVVNKLNISLIVGRSEDDASNMTDLEGNGCDNLIGNSTLLVSQCQNEERNIATVLNGTLPKRLMTLVGGSTDIPRTGGDPTNIKRSMQNCLSGAKHAEHDNGVIQMSAIEERPNKTSEKSQQFWTGQRRKHRRNRIAPARTAADPNRTSWLDFVGEKETLGPVEVDVPKEIPAKRRNASEGECGEVNRQLTAYKSRFTTQSDSRPKREEEIVWNNEKVIEHQDGTRIGTNVNRFDGSKEKRDSTKRSRRKTEPFDFEKQSDCAVAAESLGGFLTGLDGECRSFQEIPSNLCSFLSETNECDSGVDGAPSLFSGSVVNESMDSDCLALKVEALQRIFDSDCDEGDSEDGLSDSSSDGGGDFDSDGDDTDDRGEGVLLPPEPQLGNVEYKLKLVNPTKQRFEHLVTQMKWRLREGRGEAVYGIGVRDCGRVRGLRPPRLRASLRTLRAMASRLAARCSLLALLPIGSEGGSATRRRYGAEVLVRKVPDDQHNMELRVAVMGSNDAGKSTLVGVLTQGELDNGRGSARLNMFRHLHEVRTGRTSSVSHEILGFDAQGRPISYAYSDLMTAEEILEKSSKLVSFIDLAGHRKYLRTTVQGLTGYSPHLAMLVVSGTVGINQMTEEHLALLVALDLPVCVVCTKVDCATARPTQLQEALRRTLAKPGCRRVLLPVMSRDDAVMAASRVMSRAAVPIFCVSSVSGAGLDLLRWFLFLAHPAPATLDTDTHQEGVEFQIDETFRVNDTSGPVVAGLLRKGVLAERTKLLIGPLDNGQFAPVLVESLHRNRAPCRAVRAGQAASLRLSRHVPGLRQGMVLLGIPADYPHSTEVRDLCEVSGGAAPVSRDPLRILSSGGPDHRWNSEKVSPKACKKMRRRQVHMNQKGSSTCRHKVTLKSNEKKKTRQNRSVDDGDSSSFNEDETLQDKDLVLEYDKSMKITNSKDRLRNQPMADTHEELSMDDGDSSLNEDEGIFFEECKRTNRNTQTYNNFDKSMKITDNNSQLLRKVGHDVDKNKTENKITNLSQFYDKENGKIDGMMLEYDKGVVDRITNVCKQNLITDNVKKENCVSDSKDQNLLSGSKDQNLLSGLMERNVHSGSMDQILSVEPEKTDDVTTKRHSTSRMSSKEIEMLIHDMEAKRKASKGEMNFLSLSSLRDKDDVVKDGRRGNDEEFSDFEELSEDDPSDPRGCFYFQADVTVLRKSSSIYPGFQSTVHIGSIRQTAVIEGILHGGVLHAGQGASVLFRFVRHPEYVRPGAEMLFREGITAKGVGRVTRPFPHKA